MEIKKICTILKGKGFILNKVDGGVFERLSTYEIDDLKFTLKNMTKACNKRLKELKELKKKQGKSRG